MVLGSAPRYRVRLDDPSRSGIVGRFDTNQRPLLMDERVPATID